MDDYPGLGEVMYTAILRENHGAHYSSNPTMYDMISHRLCEEAHQPRCLRRHVSTALSRKYNAKLMPRVTRTSQGSAEGL